MNTPEHTDEPQIPGAAVPEASSREADVAAPPRLLADSLREERVVEEEVLAALRHQGVASLDGVEAVILETDGSFSVVHRTEGGDVRALHNLSGYHRSEHSENG